LALLNLPADFRSWQQDTIYQHSALTQPIYKKKINTTTYKQISIASISRVSIQPRLFFFLLYVFLDG
jgi:hypothetical protein